MIIPAAAELLKQEVDAPRSGLEAISVIAKDVCPCNLHAGRLASRSLAASPGAAADATKTATRR